MTAARIFELILGLVFLVGAALKAADIPGFALGIRQYQIFFDPQTLQAVAIVTVIAETLLGATLIAGIRMRGVVHAAAISLLVFFSAMIGYAWAVHGLEDCACFGSQIKMGPGPSLVKNAVMIAMLLFAWARSAQRGGAMPWSLRTRGTRVAAVAAAGVIVAGAAAVGLMGAATPMAPPPPTTAQDTDTGPAPEGVYSKLRITGGGQTYDLSDGSYLVAVMSATCEHCKDSVGALNDLAALPSNPQIIGTMSGDEGELERFRTETSPHFPTQLVDTMVWLELLGDAPWPPRFILVKNGEPLQHWAEHVPTAEAIAEASAPVAAPGDPAS